MDVSSSARSAEAAHSAERRANELYWQSASSVNRIAEDLELSKSALYGIIRPLGAGSGCPRCAEEVVFMNRTAKERERATCPECGWEGSAGEPAGAAGETAQADDAAGEAGRTARAADAGSAGDGRTGDGHRAEEPGTTSAGLGRGREEAAPDASAIGRGIEEAARGGPTIGDDASRAASALSDPGARHPPAPRARPARAGRGPAPHGDALSAGGPALAPRRGQAREDDGRAATDRAGPPDDRAFPWSARRTLAGGALLGAAAGLALVLWARRR